MPGLPGSVVCLNMLATYRPHKYLGSVVQAVAHGLSRPVVVRVRDLDEAARLKDSCRSEPGRSGDAWYAWRAWM